MYTISFLEFLTRPIHHNIIHPRIPENVIQSCVPRLESNSTNVSTDSIPYDQSLTHEYHACELWYS